MTPTDDRSFFERYPVQSYYVAALIVALVGLVLVLTVVGSIIGLPLFAVAAVLAFIGHYKSRH